MTTQPAPRDVSGELSQLASIYPQLAQASSAAQAAANRQMIQDALKAQDSIAGRLGDYGQSDYAAALPGAISALGKDLMVNGKKRSTSSFLADLASGKTTIAALSADDRARIEAAVPRPKNTYTERANAQLDGAVGQVPALLGLAQRAEANLGGTAIERELGRQAESELALGRALSPEQERAAQQSARAGFSVRGLAQGTQSLAAEILNRDVVAGARESQRRSFAGQTNQLLEGNLQSRIGQAAGIRQNAATLGLQGAQAYVGLDPQQRAMGSNIPIASQGPSASMASGTLNGLLSYGADVANTNFNAQYNGYLNDQNLGFAQQMGGQQLAAQRSASNNALLGAGIGAAGAVAGGVLIAF